MKTKMKNNLTFMCTIVMAISVSSWTYAQETPQLTNPEIASFAVVANPIDIDYGKVAIERSKNKDVIEFGNRMMANHNAIIEQAVALVTKLNVTPKDNAVSQALMSQSKKELKTEQRQ